MDVVFCISSGEGRLCNDWYEKVVCGELDIVVFVNALTPEDGISQESKDPELVFTNAKQEKQDIK
jgi:hypothetical protein